MKENEVVTFPEHTFLWFWFPLILFHLPEYKQLPSFSHSGEDRSTGSRTSFDKFSGVWENLSSVAEDIVFMQKALDSLLGISSYLVKLNVGRFGSGVSSLHSTEFIPTGCGDGYQLGWL